MNTSKSTAISPALTPYEPFYERILPTGSRVMIDPPPQDTDWDFLVLVTPTNLVTLEERLTQDGWIVGGSMPSCGELTTEHEYIQKDDGSYVMDHSRVFHSWKRQETPAVYEAVENSWLMSCVSESEGPEINLLVTCNEQYFNDFTRATFLCKALNLTDKADRVTVFEALTRDVWPTGPKKKKNKYLFKGLAEHYGQSLLQNEVNQVFVNSLGNITQPPGFWHGTTITQDEAIPV